MNTQETLFDYKRPTATIDPSTAEGMNTALGEKHATRYFCDYGRDPFNPDEPVDQFDIDRAFAIALMNPQHEVVIVTEYVDGLYDYLYNERRDGSERGFSTGSVRDFVSDRHFRYMPDVDANLLRQCEDELVGKWFPPKNVLVVLNGEAPVFMGDAVPMRGVDCG